MRNGRCLPLEDCPGNLNVRVLSPEALDRAETAACGSVLRPGPGRIGCRLASALGSTGVGTAASGHIISNRRGNRGLLAPRSGLGGEERRRACSIADRWEEGGELENLRDGLRMGMIPGPRTARGRRSDGLRGRNLAGIGGSGGAWGGQGWMDGGASQCQGACEGRARDEVGFPTKMPESLQKDSLKW